MIYKGSCHCAKVPFEVEGELAGAMACNCSICSRMGLSPRPPFYLIVENRPRSGCHNTVGR